MQKIEVKTESTCGMESGLIFLSPTQSHTNLLSCELIQLSEWLVFYFYRGDESVWLGRGVLVWLFSNTHFLWPLRVAISFLGSFSPVLETTMRYLQQAGIHWQKGERKGTSASFCARHGLHLPVLFRLPLLQFLVNISIYIAVIKQSAATAYSCFILDLTEEVCGHK